MPSRANFSSKAFCNLFLSSSCSRRSCCFRSNSSDSLWSRATSSSSSPINACTLNALLLSRRLLNGNGVLFPLSAIVSLHLGVVFFVLVVLVDDDDFCQKPSLWEDNGDSCILLIIFYSIYSAGMCAAAECLRVPRGLFFLSLYSVFLFARVFVYVYVYMYIPRARAKAANAMRTKQSLRGRGRGGG